jgi:hypothetical protein
VDTRVGPDGAVYIADWFDIRLSHLSPLDNWDKTNGRIYRLEAKGAQPMKPFDLSPEQRAVDRILIALKQMVP